jgi:hypothetical protein
MTLDERLEALTQSLELVALRQSDAEERHEREMAEIRRLALATRVDLRRAIALAVREARHERSRRRELEGKMDEKITQLAAAQLVTEEKLQKVDEKITQLAAAQLVTEEKLQAFISSMRRGGNGNP